MGQTLGAPEAMTLTGLSKSGLHKAKDEDRVFALRLSGENFDRFPLFQFSLGSVREWIPSLLDKVGNGLPAAHFLASDCSAVVKIQGTAYKIGVPFRCYSSVNTK